MIAGLKVFPTSGVSPFPIDGATNTACRFGGDQVLGTRGDHTHLISKVLYANLSQQFLGSHPSLEMNLGLCTVWFFHSKRDAGYSEWYSQWYEKYWMSAIPNSGFMVLAQDIRMIAIISQITIYYTYYPSQCFKSHGSRRWLRFAIDGGICSYSEEDQSLLMVFGHEMPWICATSLLVFSSWHWQRMKFKKLPFISIHDMLSHFDTPLLLTYPLTWSISVLILNDWAPNSFSLVVSVVSFWSFNSIIIYCCTRDPLPYPTFPTEWIVRCSKIYKLSTEKTMPWLTFGSGSWHVRIRVAPK